MQPVKVYIDGDNIPKSMWANISKAFQIKYEIVDTYVFRLAVNTNDIHRDICYDSNINLVEVQPSSKNSVDFNICYHIGTQVKHTNHFYIISNDKGFDAVKHLALKQNITISLLALQKNTHIVKKMEKYLLQKDGKVSKKEFGSVLKPKSCGYSSVNTFLANHPKFKEKNGYITL